MDHDRIEEGAEPSVLVDGDCLISSQYNLDFQPSASGRSSRLPKTLKPES
jgi:hypothetical protein